MKEATEIAVTGPTPMSEYIVELIAVAGSYCSETAILNVSTGSLEFFEKAPLNPTVANV